MMFFTPSATDWNSPCGRRGWDRGGPGMAHPALSQMTIMTPTRS
jgi:hypothetical protein